MPFLAFSQKSSGNQDYNYEVQFIRTGLEGTELFKIYSYCKKEKNCFEILRVWLRRFVRYKRKCIFEFANQSKQMSLNRNNFNILVTLL